MGKKVYLLGAGAAFLYGAPSTNDLTKSLAELCPLNRVIHTRLKKYIGQKDYNFETLLSALEYIITETEQSRKNSYHYSPLPALSWLRCCFRRGDAKKAYLESINHIIERIVPYTLNRDDTNDNLVFNHFTQADENHIYSLNYDRIIPEIFQKNGIVFSDGTVNGRAFKQSIKGFVSSSNTFFNVHGNIYLYQSPLSFYDIFQADEPSFLISLYPLNGGNPRERTFFTPIISGYSKAQHMMSKPFSFGAASFAADLQECDELEIIGYSFSDNHINSLLNSFFDFCHKKLIIVDYFEEHSRQNSIDNLQSELSSFYRYLPDRYIRDGQLNVYTPQNLYIHTGGIENYIRTYDSICL